MGNKGKKVSALASATADSAPRTVLLPPCPRYLVWMKSYLFVYVSLSAVCTLSRRCSSTLAAVPDARVCACIALSMAPTHVQAPAPNDKQPHVHTTSESESDPRVLPPRNRVSPSILPLPPRCTLIPFNPIHRSYPFSFFL